MNTDFKFPVYRYVVLSIFMLVNITIELQWLSHAAVARPAEIFYHGQFDHNSFFNIDFLAMSYMLVYLFMSLPASYIIEKYGIKKGVGLGVIIFAIFSITKAIFANNFTGVLFSQLGLAVAQPFIINAATALTVRWFPLKERALAGGLCALAQYLGIIAAMLITPLIIGSDATKANYGTGFDRMLMIYGIISLASAIIFLVFIKEKPSNLPTEHHERMSFKNGLKNILRKRDMVLTILLFLVGLGIFNAISSMTDSIAAHLGVKDSDGLIGGLMLIGGIIGAIILPLLSDYFGKRKIFLIITLAGMVPGVLGLTFAHHLSTDVSQVYSIALVSSFILGFFVMSAGPIGFQYAAEVSYPAPESASQAILLWVGQLTGMIFVAVMSTQNHLYLVPVMKFFSVLSIICLIMVFFIKESPMMKKN